MVGRVAIQQAMRHELHLSFTLISRVMLVDGRTAFAHVFALPKAEVREWDKRSLMDREKAVKIARDILTSYYQAKGGYFRRSWQHFDIDRHIRMAKACP